MKKRSFTPFHEYNQLFHNQKPIFPMKKIFLVLLFCLPLLGGASFLKAQDSIRIITNAVLTDSSCGGKYRLTMLVTNGTPASFSLDSFWTNTTGIFENVAWGPHVIYVKSTTGQIDQVQPVLREFNPPIIPFYPYPTTTDCRPGALSTVTIPAYGSNQPFQYQLDNGAFQADSVFKNVSQGIHTFTLKNTVGCSLTRVFRVFPNPGSFSPRYDISYAGKCGSGSDLKIFTTDKTLKFTFNNKLPEARDSTRDSTAYTWRNVLPNRYLLRIENSAGCSRTDSLRLTGGNLGAFITLAKDSCTNNGIGIYRINVVGGQSPYVYTLNGVRLVGTNTFRSEAFRSSFITITDANNCTFEDYLTTPGTPQLNLISDFTPTKCGDSLGIGSLRLRIPKQDSILTYPLSISFDGRPFSSDTVFANVEGNRYYTVNVKSKTGCEFVTQVSSTVPFGLSDVYYRFLITNCAANTGTLAGNVVGGTAPYTFYIDNVLVGTMDSMLIKNVKSGAHTLKIRTAEGCELVKQITLNEKLEYGYYSPSCGQAARFTLYTYNLPAFKTIGLNTPTGIKYGQRDTSGYLIWENIVPNAYSVYISDSSNCVRTVNIVLKADGLTATVERLSTTCNDTTLKYRVTPSSGTAPYTFRVNGDTTTTSSTTLQLRPGYNTIEMESSSFCKGIAYVNTDFRTDSVQVSTIFTPNNCTDNVGKLSISTNDGYVLRPLSISFNGQPFSADTVFKNVAINGIYEIKVKSNQGCDLRASVSTVYNPLSVSLQGECASRFGKGKISTQVYGGAAPYTYQWTGANSFVSNSSNLIDIPVGIYNLTVIDAAGCRVSKSATMTTCIWSGDTDTSGIVDNNDLLNIGLAYGAMGPQRITCFRGNGNNPASDSCLLWLPQLGIEWSQQTPTKVNYKHIDTNGDGIINNADTLAIKRNWRKTRAFAPENVFTRSVSPPIYVQTNQARENQWAAFPIVFGDATTPANGVYGLAFSINYDPAIIDASTVYFTYNQTWLGANSDLLSISQNTAGRLDIGLTRINHSNSSGKGQIGTLNFKLKSGVGNKALNFNIAAPNVINSNAEVMPTNPQNTTTTITGTADPEWAMGVSIYPNPTTGQFYIETQDIDIQLVTVLNISGKRVGTFKKPGKDTPLSILPSGTFFLKIETNKGVINRKIVRF
jgi:Secretion system C-terminal sorting domain